MSINVVNLTSGNGLGQAPTTSFTSVVGRLYFANIVAFDKTYGDPTISNSNGITWSKIGPTQYGPNNGAAAFYWGVAQSISTGPLTVNFPDGFNANWTTPDNALINDGTYSSQTIINGAEGINNLRFRLSDLNIPAGATITNIVLTVTARCTHSSTQAIYCGFTNGVSGSETWYGNDASISFSADNTWQTTSTSIYSAVALPSGQKAASWWNNVLSYLDVWSVNVGTVDIDNVQLGVSYTSSGSTYTIAPQNFTTTPYIGVYYGGQGGLWWIDYVDGASYSPVVQQSTNYATGSSISLSLGTFNNNANGTYNTYAIIIEPGVGWTLGTGTTSGSGQSWASSSISAVSNSTNTIGIATTWAIGQGTSATSTFIISGGSGTPYIYGWAVEVALLPAASTTSLTNSSMLLGLGI